MKSSESTRAKARETIDRITALLHEDCVTRHIDEPIDRAVAGSRCGAETPATHEQFLAATADLVSHLCAQWPACPAPLSPAQARDEAVALVALAYRDVSAAPHDTALCDAFDPSCAGMSVVLDRLAEVFKARCRQTFERWVFARHIDPLDWEVNCAMAAMLLERCASCLPAGPGQYRPHPELLVDDLPELIMAVAAIEQFGHSASAPGLVQP